MNEPHSATTCVSETATPPAQVAEPPSRAQHIIETVQTVLTALTLAFIFRAFLVEAFIIPTGSMAQSLLGAHGTRTCPACGWEYDFSTADATEVLCPNCHLRTPLPPGPVATKAGDRILVHKWPAALGGPFAPRRWDVIVFRNPSDPAENYIKRVAGRPGETVEIVDGDLFIDGRIARKPPWVQRALWFVVFDQNHYPQRQAPSAGIARWVADAPAAGSPEGWSGFETRILRYRAVDGPEQSIRFWPKGDEQYFQDVYAYNHGPSRPDGSFVGDVRVVAELVFRGGAGSMRWELLRNGHRFVAELARHGAATLTLAAPGAPAEPQLIGRADLPPFRTDRPYVIELGHLDYRVYLSVDGREVLHTTDANYAPELRALRTARRRAPVGLRISAAAVALELRGLRVDRDVHYTWRPRATQRAYAGHPFVLEADEYFVLGDNSPDSRDSREWTERGPHLADDYRLGTVRANQIVGPAALVYLPGLLPAGPDGRWQLPDLGRVRFVR